MNLYLYGLGSPFVFVDPMGLESYWRNFCEGFKGLFIGTSDMGHWDRSRQAVLAHQDVLFAEGAVSPESADAMRASVAESIANERTADTDVTQARLDAAAAAVSLVPGAGVAVVAIEAVNAGIDVSQGDYGSAALRVGGGVVGSQANRLLGKVGSQVDDAATGVRTTTPVGELRAAGLKDAHHIVQDASVKNLPGYNTNLAPGIQLPGPSTATGTPHFIATQVQRQSGGGTFAAERRIGYKALRRAGIGRNDARQMISEVDSYFRSIGVTPSTPTRVPGNRR